MVIKFDITGKNARTQRMYCDYCEDYREATHKEEHDHGHVTKSWWVCNSCLCPIGMTRNELRRGVLLIWSVAIVLFAGALIWIYTMPD